MNSNQKANYYGQLALIIASPLAAVFFSIDKVLMVFMSLAVPLPILGVWQILDFVILWRNYGYKKWYGIYLLLLSVAIFMFFSNAGFLFAVVYTWFLACIYLVMRRIFST